MKKYKIRTLTVITLFLISMFAKAESEMESLSPELRSLISKEMRALQEGMQSILPAYVSGNLKEVARIANKIENSFILKQTISEAQKKELMAKLPKAFLSMDKKFHEYAGMLEHVAEEKHTELVGFYYSKLTEACVGCHTEYGKHRFPMLKKEPDTAEHHH